MFLPLLVTIWALALNCQAQSSSTVAPPTPLPPTAPPTVPPPTPTATPTPATPSPATNLNTQCRTATGNPNAFAMQNNGSCLYDCMIVGPNKAETLQRGLKQPENSDCTRSDGTPGTCSGFSCGGRGRGGGHGRSSSSEEDDGRRKHHHGRGGGRRGGRWG